MPTAGVPRSNAAKTRNLLKLAGLPHTNETISAASGAKFAILSGRVDEVLLLNKFFPIVGTCLSCKDIAQQSCAMVLKLGFFASCILVSCMQHVSDLHPKFTPRPHNVWKYGRHPICDG